MLMASKKEQAIHVKGKNWVGVDIMSDGPDGMPMKTSMGVVLVERHFSVPLDGGGCATFPGYLFFSVQSSHRQP
ncbi:MAG: hypothetical protein Q8K75_09715 [Chlamydiales bacterium]|nr:hypothetical protein [Chlamydiales bacterium]